MTVHPNDPYYLEYERIKEFRKRNEAEGRELMTPRAVVRLFRKAPQTVRQAVRLGQVEAPYTLDATGKPVNLIRLASAVEFWKDVPDDFDECLARMRADAHGLSIYGIGWNILNPEPLASLRDPGAME